MNTLSDTPVLTPVEEDAMWATLAAEPDAIRSMANATADMQAYALRRRSYLIFENINWAINPEHVCPGITAWHRFYKNRQTKQASDANIRRTIKLLTEMVSTFEPIRKLAFMPPEVLTTEVRRYLLETPFTVSVKVMKKIALQYWGRGRYPENDVKGRTQKSVASQGV
jgi:hypothetical protein